MMGNGGKRPKLFRLNPKKDCHNPTFLQLIMDPTSVAQLISKGHSIKCEFCHQNVRYHHAKMGTMLCVDCTNSLKCPQCDDEVDITEITKAGRHKGWCIDCTRCEDCKHPMWDVVCRCQVR